jgi:transposase-like protein
MSRGRHIAWSQADTLRLETYYLVDKLKAAEIARRMGIDARRVYRKIYALRAADLRGRDHWSAEDTAKLERWYLEDEVTPRQIARRLGVRVERVTNRISYLGLAQQRSEALVAARGREAIANAVEGRLRKLAKTGAFVWTPERQADLERLYLPPSNLSSSEIARRFGIKPEQVRWRVYQTGLTKRREAMGVRRQRPRRLKATAKVVRLQPGAAAGTTAWEEALRTAPPPRPASAQEQQRRAVRASRKTQFFHANRGGGR